MRFDGKYHESVPRDERENMEWRREMLSKARASLKFRDGLMQMCRVDPIFFINAFCVQYNPDKVGDEMGPFICYPFQEACLIGGVDEEGERVWGILECVVDRRDIRWEKSREVGASYLVLFAILWLVLFHRDKSALVMSRDIDSVDKADDSSSLFGKLDLILQYLPAWMKGRITRRKLNLTFHDTHGAIVGEAATPKAGISGRNTIALMDEFGQMDHAREIFGMTRDTCKARVFVFTHHSTSTFAYELCFDPKWASMRSMLTHWSQHPEKRKGLYRYNEGTNSIEHLDMQFPAGYSFQQTAKPFGGPFPGLRSVYYDIECEVRKDETYIAMNLDIDPRGASKEFFKTHVIRELKEKCTPPLWQGDLEYDRAEGLPIRLYQCPNGPLSLWVIPKAQDFVAAVECGAGADISTGEGATPTCLSIVSCETGQKLAEYWSNTIDSYEAAVCFKAICLLFTDKNGDGAKLVWEMGGPGLTFGRALVEDLNYRSVYMDGDGRAPRFKKSGARRTYGLVTNKASEKYRMLVEYRDALREGRFVNLSWRALDECLRFVYSGVKLVEYKKLGSTADNPLASHNLHGDMVIADALAWMMVKGKVKHRENVPGLTYEEDVKRQRTFLWRQQLWERERKEELVWL